ncbi:MAG: hypothetical protein ACRD51_16205 [Candidatus Acidiferrum sp.]
MSKERIAIVVACLLVLLTPSHGGARPDTGAPVSQDMAHQLAVSTMTVKAQRFRGVRFGDEDGMPEKLGISPLKAKKFYWFDVTANLPDMASPLLGYFAVNKITGDVWTPVPCEKVGSSFIRHFQQHLIREKKVATGEFQKASAIIPCEQ